MAAEGERVSEKGAHVEPRGHTPLMSAIVLFDAVIRRPTISASPKTRFAVGGSVTFKQFAPGRPLRQQASNFGEQLPTTINAEPVERRSQRRLLSRLSVVLGCRRFAGRVWSRIGQPKIKRKNQWILQTGRDAKGTA